MATTKTLTPTNETITIDAFQGEKPDHRHVADAEGKLADAVNALNSKITPIYKKTITGTTSATGAIDSQINVDNNYIVSAAFVRGSGTAGFAFWRGNDGYLRCFDIDMQPLANTAVSIDIIYCKNSEVGTE